MAEDDVGTGPEPDTVGFRLREALADFNAIRRRQRLPEWSQADLGAEVGVKQQVISDLINNRRELHRLDLLADIARVLDISAGFLAFGQEPRRAPHHVEPITDFPEPPAPEPFEPPGPHGGRGDPRRRAVGP